MKLLVKKSNLKSVEIKKTKKVWKCEAHEKDKGVNSQFSYHTSCSFERKQYI